jgi:hypothetical protein
MEETSANSGWDYAEFVFVIDWQTNATATTIEATIQGGDGSGNGMGGYLRTFSLVDESANQYTSGGFGFFGGKANNPVNVQYDYWRYD